MARKMNRKMSAQYALKIALLCCLVLGGKAVRAGDLTAQDVKYLGQLTGIRPNESILSDMTPAESTKLHGLINEPAMQEYSMRDTLVLGNLVEVHARQCADWAKAHLSPECPPARNPAAEPGKEVADRLCNNCHLFGTTMAPSFYKLATRHVPTVDQLKAAVTSGHRMSPITLTADDLEHLHVYIEDLK